MTNPDMAPEAVETNTKIRRRQRRKSENTANEDASPPDGKRPSRERDRAEREEDEEKRKRKKKAKSKSRKRSEDGEWLPPRDRRPLASRLDSPPPALNGGRYDGLEDEKGLGVPSTSRSSRSERRQRVKDGKPPASTSATEVRPPASSAEEKKNTFEMGEDFIPFDFDMDREVGTRTSGKGKEKEKERERGRDREEHVREWDRGKRKTAEHPGRKRKADEYDQDDGYASKKERLDAASRRAPWVHDVDWESCNNVAEMLHREVEAFHRYISPTPVEDEVRGMIIAIVSKAITKQFPDAKVFPFGSYETKLYLPLGDIDLVVQSDSMAYSDKVTVLHALANTMKRAGITDKVSIIAKAKVPIIKFTTTHGRFAVDISVNQASGVPVVRMINGFLAALPALKPLVMLVKTFLHQRSMNEVFTGGLGSYSLVCMVISFLQMHPKIRRGEIDPSQNLGVLAMEFFELYGCYFNYHEVGISLRDGGTYFSKARRGWLDYNRSHLLSIEDPADPSNDISKGSYGINRVRTTLAGAHGIMTAAAYLRAGMISARREGRTVRLRDRSDPEEMSILSSVLGVTQQTVNHRKLVQEVFVKGILHRMLGITPSAALPPRSRRSPSPRAPKRKLSSERLRQSASVASAWGEADMDMSPSVSDREENRAHANGPPAQEEESRYAIDKRQPPRKRRRTGTAQDAHTYFTTDDEEEEGIIRDDHIELNIVDGGTRERSVSPKGRSPRAKYSVRNRSYWLSKGIGEGSSEEELSL